MTDEPQSDDNRNPEGDSGTSGFFVVGKMMSELDHIDQRNKYNTYGNEPVISTQRTNKESGPEVADIQSNSAQKEEGQIPGVELFVL